MYLKKSILMIAVVVLSVSWMAGKGNISKNASVEEIFQYIQTVGPRYTYHQQVVTFKNEGMNLVATLVIPATPQKPPIVLTFNGFGEDRFYKIVPGTGGEYYYDRLSRFLAEQGIATLRVDYRGSGASDGTFNMLCFSTQISDVSASIDYVQKNLRNRVDCEHLGLVGHSQGGLVSSIAAARDKRVKAVTVWSAVANPPTTFEFLCTKEKMREGLNLPDGGSLIVPVWIETFFYGNFDLGKCFFQDVYSIDPIAEIKNYKGPFMYIGGLQDIIVSPQPYSGELYMKYHTGTEKLIMLDTDHEFNSDYYPEDYDKTLYWTAAWFIKTL